MSNPSTALHGTIGDRALVRSINGGMCNHAVHTHGNHMEWLTSNGQIRPQVWKKDIIRLDHTRGTMDMIYPFEAPPDAWPPETTGCYPMHLHDEMSQTSAGGSYMFGALTDIYFE
jgi:FtsP/CotA-like multicopper oxidase with cupredoxin domain